MKKIIRVISTIFSGGLAIIFTHLFCCGLPAVFSIIGVGASTTGTMATVSEHFEWIEVYKNELFIFGGLMLAFSFYTHWRDRHVCPLDGNCKRTKHFAKIVLGFSSILYFVSLYLAFFYLPSCSVQTPPILF